MRANRRLSHIVIAVAAALSLGGCGKIGPHSDEDPATLGRRYGELDQFFAQSKKKIEHFPRLAEALQSFQWAGTPGTGSYSAALLTGERLKDDIDGIAWTRIFEDPAIVEVSAIHPVLDSSHRYIVAGLKRGADGGPGDVFVRYAGADGSPVAEATIGGDDKDYAYAIARMDDSMILFGGQSSSFGDFSGDIWVSALGPELKPRWDVTTGKTGTDTCIAIFPGETALAVSRTYNGANGLDARLTTVDANGAIIGEKFLERPDDQFVNHAFPSADGNIVLVGTTGKMNSVKLAPIVIVVSRDGTVLREVSLEDEDEINPNSTVAAETRDGGFVFAAGARPHAEVPRPWGERNGGERVLVTKISASGEIAWRTVIGGQDWDSPRAVFVRGEETIVAAASTSYGDAGIAVYSLDTAGVLSETHFLGEAGYDYRLLVAELTPDDGFILGGSRSEAGSTSRAAFLMKLDSEGRGWMNDAPLGVLNPQPKSGPAAGEPGEAAAPQFVAGNGPKAGDAAPEINAAEWINTNSPVLLEGLRGKVVVVEFWATWCGPCRASTPHLVELGHQFKDRGVVIVSLTDEKRGEAPIDAFLKEFNVDYIVGTGSTSNADYGVTGIPTAFVLSREGKVSWVGHPMDDLAAHIESALAEQ